MAVSYSNNNLSKRFSIDKETYNSLTDLPSKGSCFGVIGNAPILINDSFSIPVYSRFAFINTGDSADGALVAIDAKGIMYSAYRNNGIWSTGQVSASKSDLFGELCTNPNTLTALVAMVNGYDSNVTNIPDAAKKKFSIILNVWASPLSYLGDLTKTHMQVLIIGSGGGVVTRKYESNAWSNWQ